MEVTSYSELLLRLSFRPQSDTSQMTVNVNIEHCGHIGYQRKPSLQK